MPNGADVADVSFSRVMRPGNYAVASIDTTRRYQTLRLRLERAGKHAVRITKAVAVEQRPPGDDPQDVEALRAGLAAMG